MGPEVNSVLFLVVGLVIGIAGALAIVVVTGFGAGRKAEEKYG